MNDQWRAEAFNGPALSGQAPGDVRHAFVHSVSLSAFDQLVRSLGGDPRDFVDPAAIICPTRDNDGGIISYRDFINVLHVSAKRLNCPSFGLQLARQQADAPVLPISMGIAMRHSETIGAAYRYCAEHLQSFSPVLQTRIETMPDSGMIMHRFDILLDRVPHQQQAVEHAIALLHHSLHALSAGTVRSRGIWFKHDPVATIAAYREYFRADVRFGMPMTGVLLSPADMDTPLPNRNPHLHELATRFIESQYPSPTRMLSHRVRSIVLSTLGTDDCTHEAAARALAMHPRTLQRRLRDEGATFEAIRDEIRKEMALQYFAQPTVPLIRIAGLLGYSEQSVLTRSCHRWFDRSPQQLRQQLQAGA